MVKISLRVFSSNLTKCHYHVCTAGTPHQEYKNAILYKINILDYTPRTWLTKNLVNENRVNKIGKKTLLAMKSELANHVTKSVNKGSIRKIRWILTKSNFQG